jgi:hypothetical protein
MVDGERGERRGGARAGVGVRAGCRGGHDVVVRGGVLEATRGAEGRGDAGRGLVGGEAREERA